MPSLAFTTLVTRSTESAGSNASASAPPEVAEVVKKGVDPVLSHPLVLVGLAIFGALVALSIIAYFTYRVVSRRQRKDRSPRSYLRPFMMRGGAVQSRSDDDEKGRKSVRELIDKISIPTLLYGTGSFALDDPVIGNSKDISEMDVTEVRFEHDQDLLLSGKDNLDQSQRAMESPKCAGEAAVNLEVAETIESGIAIDACSETEISLKLYGPGDAPVCDSASLPKRDVAVINDEKGIEGAGLTMNNIDALRNKRELFDDEIPIRVAALRNTRELRNDEIPVRAAPLLTLSDKFNAYETFGEEAYIAHLDSGAYDGLHSSGSLSSYSTFDIHDLKGSFTLSTSPEDVVCSTPASSPRHGLLRPSLTSFESKEDAQATLLGRRVDMQRSPELCFLIPNPVTQDDGPVNSAATPALCRPELMTLERYVSRSRAAQIHRPSLTSPLASGFVICGPGCPPSKGLKVALRGLLPSKTKTRVIRHGPTAKPSAVIAHNRPSSELLVDVFKRMLCRGSLAEPWTALTLFTTSTAQSAVQSLIQSPTSHPSTAITMMSSTVRVSQASAVPMTSGAASPSRPARVLIINKANLRSPPRTSTSRSSPVKRSAPSTCTRMPAVVEELEKDNLSLRSPSTAIGEPRARRSSVAPLSVRRSATTAISGASKSSKTVKEKDFKSLHSPTRARRVAIVSLPYGFPSPPLTVEFCHSPRPTTVSLRSRHISKPSTLKRASIPENALVNKIDWDSLTGIPRAKHHSLSDISNCRPDAHSKETTRPSNGGRVPLDRRPVSMITLRASPVVHTHKSLSSIRTNENLRPA